MAGSAAGEYLAKMGLPEEDFNSYATHRGDHLVWPYNQDPEETLVVFRDWILGEAAAKAGAGA